MNFKKRLLVFCLILCVLFSISSVYASDIDDAVIASDISDEAITIEDTNDELIAPSDEEETVGASAGTFSELQDIINQSASGSTISLDKDYAYDSGFNDSGIQINKSLTINGNGHTLDGLSKSRIFKVTYNKECIEEYHTIVLNNIIFKNGNSYLADANDNEGGAIFMSHSAISNGFNGPWYPKNCNVKINNCVFTGNYARTGGAIYSPSYINSYGQYNYLTINNSAFINNSADSIGGAIYFYGNFNVINSDFLNNSAYSFGGAIYASGQDETINVQNSIFSENTAKYGGAIYGDGDWADGNIILNIANSIFIKNQPTGENGAIYIFTHVKCKISGCSFIDDTNTILASSKLTATYGVSKNLVVTLKDGAGNALKSMKVTIKVGSISKTLITNAKGQVSLAIKGLVPKTYTAQINFAGDEFYTKSSKKVTVVVKKASPKMTAKAKTFKVKVKAKKYKITLKDNTGKVMKSTKISLKVNKKTFSAKTNKKGIATFKITNLKKKGKFTAVIKYAGNKYYNKVTKKAKITVKK